ncbi:MAG TPA: hypothetical protein VMS02_09745 [Solirubrobacteraceae bacterium]|nr:hypothetical protein [Solirubrobacteraceae bacterium]
MSAAALERLRALLLAEGGLLAGLLADIPASNGSHAARPADPVSTQASAGAGAGPAQLAAAGPRTCAQAAEYELLLEAIFEGYLLHYGAPRLLRSPEEDLGLLAGDRLYALGLARLVALGDVVAVAELADVITLTALAHGAGQADLADAIWTAGARAVGWGPSERHRQAKSLARAGDPGALAAMRLAAERDDE